MRGNPEEFRAAARSIRSAMIDAHRDAGRLRSASVYFERWRSPAATEFSSGYHRSAQQSVGYVIRDLGDLADMLDRAANDLQEVIGTCKAIERNVVGWFANQPVPEDGSPPVWEQQWWRYRPGRLPTTGDSEWLEVRGYLRGLGVPC